MAEDFYPFVDSGDPAPDNRHLNGIAEPADASAEQEDDNADTSVYATRIAVYDDMLSTPRVLVIEPKDVRAYLEEITNTVYRCMKEQGGAISLMVIREIVENFIHAHFAEPIISVLDGGNTIRFADQGPGINDKERAFEFGVTSANRDMKRYIRGTGAGFPMVQQYLENSGGAVSIEDNLGQGTVVTVSVDPGRVTEIEQNAARGAAVRTGEFSTSAPQMTAAQGMQNLGGAPVQNPYQQPGYGQPAYGQPMQQNGYPQPWPGYGNPYGAPTYQQPYQAQPAYPTYGAPAGQPYATPAYPQQGYQQGYQQQMPMQQGAPMQGAQAPYVTDRGKQALSYLQQNGQCGPTELQRALGSSVPTWSRELDKLAGSGFTVKHGKKYFLTDLGQAWIAENN